MPTQNPIVLNTYGTKGKKIYFVADQHFGIPNREKSHEREKLLIAWLEEIRPDAEVIFFMGDLFDFWFEYRQVVQRGYVRLFGKLAELIDAGIPIYYFRGNHDVWAFDYLETEIGMHLKRQPEIFTLFGKRFFLAHGDGLGKGDNGYKMIKKVFECRFNQWCFRWIHPDWGTRLGWFFSRRSRYSKTNERGEENVTETERSFNSRMPDFCRKVLETEPIDYFIFGHYHHIIEKTLDNGTKIFTIGDWMQWFSYGVFDGQTMKIEHFTKSQND
ncbi:MAG: UDP-2,3-diacylglucosamine diphosphatase [Bacteroidales bacterium]|nr:UDP-2,3-diacylglucosamine diphosphatase [Bacteroidales bacterium]